MKKRIGDNIEAESANWKFKGDVVKKFEEHILKSVPLYKEGHDLIKNLSDFFIKDDSICYELGSSTGRLIFELSKRHRSKIDAEFIGIDIEEEMIKRAKTLYKNRNLSYICEDINLFDFKKSDMIISYYTVQFIHPKYRQNIFNKIYDSLHWGGAFIFFEKVRASDGRFQDITTSLYTDFKLKQGYSESEIIAKSQSLKGVLEPFSTQGNLDLLKRAGFLDSITIQKYINFEGFLAIK